MYSYGPEVRTIILRKRRTSAMGCFSYTDIIISHMLSGYRYNFLLPNLLPFLFQNYTAVAEILCARARIVLANLWNISRQHRYIYISSLYIYKTESKKLSIIE